MALPVNRPLQEWNIDFHLADVTTSGTEACAAFAPAPFKGKIVRVYSTQYTGASGAATVINTNINGTAVTGASMTWTTTTGLAGKVYSATPTADATTYFNEGDVIGMTSTGASDDGTVAVTLTAVVRRV